MISHPTPCVDGCVPAIEQAAVRERLGAFKIGFGECEDCGSLAVYDAAIDRWRHLTHALLDRILAPPARESGT